MAFEKQFIKQDNMVMQTAPVN